MAQGSNEPVEGLYSDNEYYEVIKKDSLEKTPRLLVEGKDDRVFFEKLIEHLLLVGVYNEQMGRRLNRLKENIDVADILSSGGNRKRIERMCFQINQNFQNNHSLLFVGFEDREYRDFDIRNRVTGDTGEFTDDIGKHYEKGVNVWSRGHSIENYFFEIDCLKSVYRNYLRKVEKNKDEDRVGANRVIQLFEDNFDEGLKIALYLSMIAIHLDGVHPTKTNKKMRKSIATEFFGFTDGVVQFKVEEWSKRAQYKFNEILLTRESRISAQELQQHWTTWKSKISAKTINCYPYITHGHITEQVLYTLFRATVSHIDTNTKKVDNPYERFLDYSDKWLELKRWDRSDSPMIVLKKLGINHD